MCWGIANSELAGANYKVEAVQGPANTRPSICFSNEYTADSVLNSKQEGIVCTGNQHSILERLQGVRNET
jgi:hypothetical protein